MDIFESAFVDFLGFVGRADARTRLWDAVGLGRGLAAGFAGGARVDDIVERASAAIRVRGGGAGH